MTHTGCLLATIDAEIGKTGEKSGHTSFSPSTVVPPQPSGSASSPPHGPRPVRKGPGLARFSLAGSPMRGLCALGQNAIHLSSMSRP